MAKPIKLKKAENSDALFECQCGELQVGDLTPCPRCHRHLCDVCMSFGPGVPCVDCGCGMDEV